MPNIIEQQDLLKGLPDARLALLMKNPVGDIPPFLVAAEAQRRQSVRQQYAGQGSDETVVDSLTKQMANVPQNLQQTPQMPPNIPPPQQAGIAAIPQQGMASGGPVRRFNVAGYVTPTVDSMGTDYFQDPFGAPSVGGEIDQESLDQLGRDAYGVLQNLPNSPFPRWYEPGTAPPPNAPDTRPNLRDELNQVFGPRTRENPQQAPQQPRDETAGTADSSPENRDKSTQEAFRQRIRDLYGSDDPSNWEKAQKWFAMAQQIMNPDQTVMQGLANAGMAYAQASGGEAAARREAERRREGALLKYDMDEYENDREARAAAAAKADDRAFELRKLLIPSARDAIGAYNDSITAIEKALADGMLSPEQTAAYERQLQSLQAQRAAILDRGGFATAAMPTRDDLESMVNSGQ